MTSIARIEREKKRQRLIETEGKRRDEVRKQLKNKNLSYEERQELNAKFQKFSRNSSYTRRNQRCNLDGRPKGVYRKFKINRVAFRKMASEGLMPGVVKSSW